MITSKTHLPSDIPFAPWGSTTNEAKPNFSDWKQSQKKTHVNFCAEFDEFLTCPTVIWPAHEKSTVSSEAYGSSIVGYSGIYRTSLTILLLHFWMFALVIARAEMMTESSHCFWKMWHKLWMQKTLRDVFFDLRCCSRLSQTYLHTHCQVVMSQCGIMAASDCHYSWWRWLLVSDTLKVM